MIKVGKAFSLPRTAMPDELFVPIRFTCKDCHKPCQAIVIDKVAIEVAAGRLYCYDCGSTGWRAAARVLGRDSRKGRPVHRHLTFPLA